jgi:hypothetical protein
MMMIKGLIVNHTAPDRNKRRYPNGGKLSGLFHRNVKKPVHFRGLDGAQLLNS